MYICICQYGKAGKTNVMKKLFNVKRELVSKRRKLKNNRNRYLC